MRTRTHTHKKEPKQQSVRPVNRRNQKNKKMKKTKGGVKTRRRKRN